YTSFVLLCFLTHSPAAPRDLHFFPTRRTSDLLDQDGVGLADVKDEVLLLVGEQAADHIVGRDVPARYHPDDEHHPGHIGGKVQLDRKSTRLNSSHVSISYAVFCLKKKTT